MINHLLVQQALRTKLLTLEVCTTGAISVAGTATGYTRTTGSFLADGFVPGMEVTGTGFSETANNEAKTVDSVTALTLTCSGCTAEAAASRTLAVDLPASRAWEGIHFEPTTGSPYIEESYLAAPMTVTESGSLALLEVLPTYVIRFYVPANRGIEAARSYTDAMLTLFAPGTRITVSGATCIVRENPAPYTSQLLATDDGFVTVAVNVPLRLTTANTV